MSVIERFWAKVDKTGECWEWTGARYSGKWPYGEFKYGDQGVIGAHRASWMIANGPIPDGVMVLHHCDNPPCVRPDHLFLGTPLDNMRDMWAKGRAKPGPGWKTKSLNRDKTHCKNGHPFSPENTYRYPPRKDGSPGQRACRICVSQWASAYRQRRSA